MRVISIDSLEKVAAAEWNRLVHADYPFLRHEFLHAAETSDSVCEATGWQPCHLLLRSSDNELVAAMPLYEKSHSWGEFVFDWAWANAYQQAGFDYYPKLVSAVPFTPAGSPRVLCGEQDPGPAAAALLDAAIALAKNRSMSSLHLQFPSAKELPALERAGLKLRKDCQFHWHNPGYRNFDEFIARFSSRKRKKARQDRKRVQNQGISFRWLQGADLDDATLHTVYRLISITFMQRGSLPYLTEAFFRQIRRTMPDQLLVVLAEMEGRAIAAAVFYVGKNRLYGRYWGSDAYYDALHFETCYYQGIEYCIQHGLQFFEPGTQGEHKISRGFVPVTTWSAHWLAHDAFFDAIGRYLDEEQRHIDQYIHAVDEHSPYRRTPGADQ
ncbi:MAG: GNAT family N-acetyltransferase [Woeseia sp.]